VTFKYGQSKAEVGVEMIRNFDFGSHRVKDAKQAKQFFIHLFLERVAGRLAGTRRGTFFVHFSVKHYFQHALLKVMKLTADVIEHHFVVNPADYRQSLVPLFKGSQLLRVEPIRGQELLTGQGTLPRIGETILFGQI
jgi:hypothetical protein